MLRYGYLPDHLHISPENLRTLFPRTFPHGCFWQKQKIEYKDNFKFLREKKQQRNI